MSPNEKMQALFDAAIKAEPKISAKPERACPKVDPTQLPSDEDDIMPSDSKASETPKSEPAAQNTTSAPAGTIGAVDFSKKEAEALGELLEEQMARSRRKRKKELVLTLLFFGGTTLGSVGWFVSDGDRVKALMNVIADIRSVSDVQSIVSKFQDSLDRISVRGNQIDQATAAMGVTVKPGELKDQYMEEEMKQMMGGEGGKTVGQRNRQLQEAFADRAEKAGGAPQTSAESEKLKKFREDNAFEWDAPKK